jgi:DNA repair protein RadC
MAKKSTKAEQDRRNRYSLLLRTFQQHDQFTYQDIREALPEESRAFVTRLAKQMHRQGWLMVHDQEDGIQCNWLQDRSQFDPDHWVDQQLCGLQIRQAPVQERPRERLMSSGAGALRTADLLAILIRSGRPGESAVQAGEKIAARFDGALERLMEASISEMKQISTAVSQAAFCQILAGIELGRRVCESLQVQTARRYRIDSSQAARDYCRHHFARLASDRRQEEFHIVTLDTKLQPISHHQITVGTLDASLVAPREVFRPAIRDAAAAVLLVHNHPSGDPTPSRQDFEVTSRLESAAKLIGIQVVDHIVVGTHGAVSVKESR